MSSFSYSPPYEQAWKMPAFFLACYLRIACKYLDHIHAVYSDSSKIQALHDPVNYVLKKKNHTSSTICAAHIFLDVQLSLENSLPAMPTSPLHTGILSGLSLTRSCVCCFNCCELMGVTTLLCPENTVSCCYPVALTIFLPLLSLQ